jgi:TM2 domain-containing membrane protein YozV
LQNKLVCRECLGAGRAAPQSQSARDPNTAFIIELVGGFFGLLGLGYFYIGQTSDGIIRLVAWIIYNVVAYIIITLLISVIIGIACCPFQLIIQIAVPLWSATTLKNQLLGGPSMSNLPPNPPPVG